MKHFTLERVVIIVLLGIVVWQMCTEPEQVESPRILELENSLRHRDLKIDSLAKGYTAALNVIKKDSIELVQVKASFKTASNRFERKVAASQPIVLQQIDSLPIVKAYLEDLDSISTLKDDYIRSLEYLYGKLEINMIEITANLEKQLEVTRAQLEDQGKISEQWKKEAKKKDRKGRGWKALAAAGTVLGLIVGASL